MSDCRSEERVGHRAVGATDYRGHVKEPWEMSRIFTVSKSVSWLGYCARVLQDVTFERNWVKDTWDFYYFL